MILSVHGSGLQLSWSAVHLAVFRCEDCDNIYGTLVVAIDDLVSSLKRAPVTAAIVKISTFYKP